jgi:hypothetical protein
MKLLEVVRGARTSAGTLATAMKLAKRIGKTAVVSGVCDGFIGNRMVEHYLRQAVFLVEEGATPAEVDGALERFGMAMGPFRMSDLAGSTSAGRSASGATSSGRTCRGRASPTAVRAGALRPEDRRRLVPLRAGKRDALPDPAVDAIIDAYRASMASCRARSPRTRSSTAAFLALVAEGARVLDDGVAQRASDIDVVYLTGYGFPRHRGGPMFYADTRGSVRRRAPDARVRGARRSRPRVLDAVAAHRAHGERRRDVQPMTAAVIVSTARTPLAKSWRGAFNMTHGATLGGHAVRHALERARLAPAEVDDVVMGCALPEGATGWNIARQIALRAGCPVEVPA